MERNIKIYMLAIIPSRYLHIHTQQQTYTHKTFLFFCKFMNGKKKKNIIEMTQLVTNRIGAPRRQNQKHAPVIFN